MVIEDDLPGESLRARQNQLGLARLGRIDLEDIGAIDLFHGEEGGGHAAAGAQELPPAQAQPLAVEVGQLEDPPLDALLCFALRRGGTFSPRAALGPCRWCGSGRITPCQARFSVTAP